MKTQYNEIHDTLVAVSVAINNNYTGFESNMAQHKLEEARMWFDQSSKMQPVQCTPEINTDQLELALAVKGKCERKIYQKCTTEDCEEHPKGQRKPYEAPSAEEAPKLPTKEELIFMAKEFGKTHGADNFVSLLGTFNAKNISELYAQGEEVVLKFVSAISN